MQCFRCHVSFESDSSKFSQSFGRIKYFSFLKRLCRYCECLLDDIGQDVLSSCFLSQFQKRLLFFWFQNPFKYINKYIIKYSCRASCHKLDCFHCHYTLRFFLLKSQICNFFPQFSYRHFRFFGVFSPYLSSSSN